jgi:cyclase
MLLTRVIPVVLLKDGHVVQSKNFRRHQLLGNPQTIVGRLSNWHADELIYLDISRDPNRSLQRDDLNFTPRYSCLEMIRDVSRKCFMPLTVGGGIRRLEDVLARLEEGADKVSINRQAYRDPGLVERCAQEFGSQCIVASVDARRVGPADHEVFVEFGRSPTGMSPEVWARRLEDLGAVIALGGAGKWQHFGELMDACAPSALAASNIFQYTENSVYHAAKFLHDAGYGVRPPQVASVMRREIE